MDSLEGVEVMSDETEEAVVLGLAVVVVVRNIPRAFLRW